VSSDVVRGDLISPLDCSSIERVVSSDMVRGDLISPRTTPLDTTPPSTIFYRLLLN
jgi:hypothetical protein